MRILIPLTFHLGLSYYCLVSFVLVAPHPFSPFPRAFSSVSCINERHILSVYFRDSLPLLLILVLAWHFSPRFSPFFILLQINQPFPCSFSYEICLSGTLLGVCFNISSAFPLIIVLAWHFSPRLSFFCILLQINSTDGPGFIVHHSSRGTFFHIFPPALAFFYSDVIKSLTDGPSVRLSILVYLTAEIAFASPEPPLPHSAHSQMNTGASVIITQSSLWLPPWDWCIIRYLIEE